MNAGCSPRKIRRLRLVLRLHSLTKAYDYDRDLVPVPSSLPCTYGSEGKIEMIMQPPVGMEVLTAGRFVLCP